MTEGKISFWKTLPGMLTAAGTLIGTLVTAYVALDSHRNRDVLVPSVVNLELAQAKKLITDSGLKLGATTQEFSDDVSSGKVLRQHPEAGKEAPSETIVTLTVSKPFPLVQVPQLTRITFDEAVQRIASNSLKLGLVKDVWDDRRRAGTIISQSIDPGTRVKENTEINLTRTKKFERVPFTLTQFHLEPPGRIVRGDGEIDTDDWTRVDIQYELVPTQDRRGVDLVVSLDAYEANKNQSLADTHLQRKGSVRIHTARSNRRVQSIEGCTLKASASEFLRNELHGWQNYKDVGSLRQVRFVIDGSGGNDQMRMQLKGRISCTAVEK